jgi:hypothetical protein
LLFDAFFYTYTTYKLTASPFEFAHDLDESLIEFLVETHCFLHRSGRASDIASRGSLDKYKLDSLAAADIYTEFQKAYSKERLVKLLAAHVNRRYSHRRRLKKKKSSEQYCNNAFLHAF